MKKILMLAASVLCGMSAFAGNPAEGVVQKLHSSLVCHSLCFPETPKEELDEFLEAELNLVIPETIDGKHSSVLERRLIYKVFGYKEALTWEQAIEKYNNTSFNEAFFSLFKKVSADKKGMNVYLKKASLDSVVRVGDLCSFRQESFLYTGGAHGDSGMEYVNYDCKTDKIVLLPALLTDKAAAKNIILKAIVKKMGYKTIAELRNNNGIDPSKFKISNNFYTDKDNVIFVFNTYELGGCFADGRTEVEIPKKVLKPILTAYGQQLLLN